MVGAARDGIPADFHRRFLESLGRQVEALRGALDPARNHRTLELSAIFLAAVALLTFRLLRNLGLLAVPTEDGAPGPTGSDDSQEENS